MVESSRAVEKLSVDELLGWSWEVYRERLEITVPFAVFALLVLFLELSVSVVTGVFEIGTDLTVTLDPDFPEEVLFVPLTEGLVWIFFAGVAGNAILVTLAMLVAVGTAVLVADDYVTGSERSLAHHLLVALARLSALLIAILVAIPLIVIGLVALLVPGVYLCVKFALAGPAILVDGHGPIGGLRTAWTASTDRFVTIFGVGVLGVLAIAVVSAIPYIGPVLSALVLLPIFSFALTRLYFQTRGSSTEAA